MPPFKRLFIGLELPPSCKATLAELNPNLRGLRWVGPEQRGLEKEGVLHENLSNARVPPFFLPLKGVGFFRSRGRPSVVWVGVGNGHPHLFALHRRVQDAVLRAGLEPDLRPFHPHVTVGRAREISTHTLQPFIRKHADDELGLFEVKEFILFSSLLAPEDATYFPELRVPLE